MGLFSYEVSFQELDSAFFFFNDTATTEIYTLSLHDALPISGLLARCRGRWSARGRWPRPRAEDRKSTRLNSSHVEISYAVFCLKNKKRWFRAWLLTFQYKKMMLSTRRSSLE